MGRLVLSNAADKFKNARELCPGMSEETYVLTDYIGKYIGNNDVYPEGIMIHLLCVQDDLKQGKCGFVQTDAVPEIFITRRDLLLAQLCYIVQVIDAIAEEDFADAVRNECEGAFGWKVPKQVTVGDQLDYPPYVMAAVDWWTNAVQHPKMDNGEGSMDLLMALFGGSVLAKTSSATEMRAFRSTLAAGIASEVKRCGRSRLYVDYGPEGVLAKAGAAAKMGGFSFPCKTSMSITEHAVEVSAGYGAPYETIWRA